MSSGITFSGFNNIDFNVVLNALMKQAAIPLNQLQAKQNALKTQQTNLDTLSSKLSALSTAATNLSKPENLSSATATTSVGGYQLEKTGIQLFETIAGDHFTILGMPLFSLLPALRAQKCLAE